MRGQVFRVVTGPHRVGPAPDAKLPLLQGCSRMPSYRQTCIESLVSSCDDGRINVVSRS